ncbi:MAG: hypothetical protein RMJ84_05840, partial [Sandaracinaceae bacterium]|nr:hypothetical protein [Sandaracinaceae bacterium]
MITLSSHSSLSWRELLLCAWIVAGVVGCITLAIASPLHAQEVEGSVGAHLLLNPPDVGGALSVDAWGRVAFFRLGGTFGAMAFPSENDARNRAMMPIGILGAVEGQVDKIGFGAGVRGGAWGGASQEVKLSGGLWVGASLFLDIPIGPEAKFGPGVDVWGFGGGGSEMLLWVATLRLSWFSPS